MVKEILYFNLLIGMLKSFIGRYFIWIEIKSMLNKVQNYLLYLSKMLCISRIKLLCQISELNYTNLLKPSRTALAVYNADKLDTHIR